MTVCSLHNHTNFCDGVQTPEEMARTALEAGCRVFGISEHSPAPWDPEAGMEPARVPEYRRRMEALKAEYAGRMEICCGIEQDIFSPAAGEGWDYVIGSVHYVPAGQGYRAVDLSREDFARTVSECFGGDALAFAESYYRQVSQIVTLTDCEIIGHFDLITKFNEDHAFFDPADPRYLRAVRQALDALTPAGRIFEINSGAMSRGYRKAPYPEPWILRELRDRDARILLSSDAHSRGNILYGFGQMQALAKECGFEKLTVLHDGAWTEEKL